MDAAAFRTLIRDRIGQLELSVYRTAGLADIGEQTLRDYLAGRSDLRSAAALSLAAALGLRVAVRPTPRFRPPAPAGPGPGRPKKKPENVPGIPGH